MMSAGLKLKTSQTASFDFFVANFAVRKLFTHTLTGSG